MRKRLLGYSLSIALVMLCASLQPLLAAYDVRVSAPASVRLTLAGQSCGFVKQASGGDVIIPTITYPDGPTRLGTPTYSNIALQLSLGMGSAVYQWIAESWQSSVTSALAKDGDLTSLDSQMVPVSRKTFTHSLIAETTIPSCDASRIDAGYLAVLIAPSTIEESLRLIGAQPLLVQPPRQRIWRQSDFRLQIDGLDCTHVAKIDAFTVKREVIRQKVGELRADQLAPGRLILPHLKVTLPASFTQTWSQWLTDQVTGKAAPKSGQLVLLTSDLNTPMATMRFAGLKILSLQSSTTAGGVSAKTAELVCDQMTFTAAGG